MYLTKPHHGFPDNSSCLFHYVYINKRQRAFNACVQIMFLLFRSTASSLQCCHRHFNAQCNDYCNHKWCYWYDYEKLKLSKYRITVRITSFLTLRSWINSKFYQLTVIHTNLNIEKYIPLILFTSMAWNTITCTRKVTKLSRESGCHCGSDKNWLITPPQPWMHAKIM